MKFLLTYHNGQSDRASIEPLMGPIPEDNNFYSFDVLKAGTVTLVNSNATGDWYYEEKVKVIKGKLKRLWSYERRDLGGLGCYREEWTRKGKLVRRKVTDYEE